MLTTLIYSLFLTIPTTLLLTIMLSATQQMVLIMMKRLTLLSSVLTLLFLNSGCMRTLTTMTWVPTDFSLKINFTLDQYSMLFLPIALLISWTILEFSNWYMAMEPNILKFSKYLMLFLLTMLIFISSNNMLQLFIGWEGVGIMSFLLISWWSSRTNANTAALQAVIYNRIGDVGLILTLMWTMMSLNSWNLDLLFAYPTTSLVPLLGLLLAAAGKSAQFGLHPWLPMAMEGPTPVSALLHSSTMVVAGVFLLIRFHQTIQIHQAALTLCLCLGALTTLFSALCACTQNDIKKIIAFSTSSQLGLMMVAIGINQPELAFLHITTHAFFKAMLFLCSGSIIHVLNDEQDIRKMGNLQLSLPLTTSCITLGNLALTGTPFLAGFFTKDAIIEAITASTLNAWALHTTLLATALTAVYSLRLAFSTQPFTPRYSTLTHLNEANNCQTRPLLRLAFGSIISGLLIISIFLPTKTQTMTIPITLKLSALGVTILGLIYAQDLVLKLTQLNLIKNSLTNTTLTHLGFYNLLLHRHNPSTSMKHAQTYSLQLNDSLWYETIGPKLIKTSNKLLTNTLSQTHTGLLKTYLTIFLLTMALLLSLAAS